MKINNEVMLMAMANKGLLFKDVASQAEISSEALRNIRQGKAQPRPATIGKIAKALGVAVSDLIEGDE